VIRWTDKTMAKTKQNKGQTVVDQTLHRKLNVEQQVRAPL